MALERQDYPAMLPQLQPPQAVDILNERVRQVGKLNVAIADWLQDRRRLEEQYSAGLRKLAQKQLDAGDLGVFSTPWGNIISSAETLAASHSTLASKIEVDVERPLREFTSTSREMGQMSTVQGNLAALAKDVERAQSKVEKMRARGEREESGKVFNANSDVDQAQTQWESQAPYIFESLQALDESRLNHLRDVLTQFQTHEVDLVEKNRITAEQCLNVLLNVETKDEITTFALRAVQEPPTLAQRKRSSVAVPPRPSPSTAGSSGMTPSIARPEDDMGSQRAESIPEDKQKGKLKGLRRLGTVMGRGKRESRYGSSLPSTAETPERPKPKSSPFNSFAGRLGRSRDASTLEPMQETSPRQRPYSPMRLGSDILEPSRTQSRTGSTAEVSSPPPTGQSSVAPPQLSNGAPTLAIPNGSHQRDLTDLEPPRPAERIQESPAPAAEPQKDSEGYTLPPQDIDPITQAQQDAAAFGGEGGNSQFNVNIRDAPIQDDSGSADAFASVANKLQAPPMASKAGTIRGRRGPNRNSVLPPNAHTASDQSIAESPSQVEPIVSREAPPQLEPIVSREAPAPIETTAPSVQPPQNMSSTNLAQSTSSSFSPGSLAASTFSPFSPQGEQSSSSPFRPDSRATASVDHGRGDNQSIRSATTTASQGGTKHPELHEVGLSSSVVETIGARFENGKLISSSLIGEIALAYNATDSSSLGTETIRLDNFSNLEKVAPNPAFLTAATDKEGEYAVILSNLPKTQVAFKYQVHLDDNQSHAPLLITPAFKIEANQVSVIISYSLNPAFTLPEGRESLALSKVMLALTIEGTKATSCLSKPSGTFAREKNLIYWQLGDLSLKSGAAPEKMLARFATESEASGGHVEARWEVSGDAAMGLGSGIGVSSMQKKETSGDDPFADEDGAGGWKAVPGIKRLVSGNYGAK